ncbi:hypothetical protein FDB08_02975 [Clostridium botulinum]|nr:hypothetical protein Z953_04680 [Clostridium botulinum D str. 16868]NFF61778.1 hypothetical protein [Clostridium botulinum]NFL02217.1 hypothetical protein [Clostridium botulinum]
MIKAMSFLRSEVDLGYLIAKQNIFIKKMDFNELELKASIEKNKKIANMSYLTCNCTGYSKYEKIIELKSTLIKRENTENVEGKTSFNSRIYNENIDLSSKDFFRVITKDEVYKFIEISGDNNYIHLTKKPIVQAMLILLFLEDYLALRNIYMYKCKITYINPILAGTKIFLRWKNSKTLIGIVQNKICFNIVLKES